MMGDVPVTAQQDFAAVAPRFMRQLFQLRPELVEKAEFGLLAFVGTGTGWQVERNHRQLAEVGLQVAPFGIELGIAEALDDAVRRPPRIDADAAVTFFLGGVKAAGEAVRSA